MKKITVKRSDVFGENETSDELRRRKQKDGRDFSYRSGHSKVIDSEYLQKNIHLSIKIIKPYVYLLSQRCTSPEMNQEGQ